jgi:ubiquinone/menaquinone biosynthesis C-methylase UbiE
MRNPQKRLVGMAILSIDKGGDQQTLVNSLFEDDASYWAEIYERTGVKEFVHQQRLRTLLELVERIAPPAQSLILDAGCGAGLAAVALARRGYHVQAMDAVEAMVDLTSRRAIEAGVERRVTTTMGDVDSLPFGDKTFPLVVMMGVLPWLPSIEKPLRELHRVIQPAGHLIVSLDNRWSLCRFLDPFINPVLSPGKELVRSLLYRLGRTEATVHSRLTSNREFDLLLKTTGFKKTQAKTLGFGPFTVFRHEFLPSRVGLTVHQGFQAIAERGFPIFRSAGMQSIVVASRA